MKVIPQSTVLPISEIRVSEAVDAEKKEKNNFRRHSELLPPHNIRALFVGPSACGKTSALMSLVYNIEGISFKNLYVVGKSLYQPKYQELDLVMKNIPEIGFFVIPDLSTVPHPDEILPFSAIIFDDVATENDKNQHLRAYFSMGRHKHVDSFFLCQTYSSIPKQLVRDNANVSITLADTRRKKNMYHVFSFIFFVSPRYIGTRAFSSGPTKP